MPDLLIRNFPVEDLALLDERAARLGVSRTEFVRLLLHQDACRTATTVTAADLSRFSAAAADLADDAGMSDAWS